MCGIAGYLGTQFIDDATLTSTLNTMKSRGPDASRFVRFERGNLQAVLLHSRLSIIDLNERSNQPFKIGPYTLIFNGEIYNYLELKSQLEKGGLSFHTNSDTEVLLQSYIKYGKSCVDRFEGMWAFCIYDETDNTLFLSRDRFAEKPLYYARRPDGFYFASETRTLRELCSYPFRVNEGHLTRYLVNGYKSLYKEPDTFYEGIEELKYASHLQVSSDLKYSVSRYWTPRFLPQPNMSLEEAIEGVRERLLQSVKLRLRSDVPLAFCLSGGVDSASLVSMAAKHFGHQVEAFSIIEEDERYNEYDNIMATVQDIGCKPHLIRLDTENSIDSLKALVRYHDAPIATTTYYVHSLLSREIAKNGFRVVFSGTSADELFTGYYDHFNLHLYEMRQHPRYAEHLRNWKQHAGKFVRNPYLKDPELYIKDPSVRAHIYLKDDEFSGYLKAPFREGFKEEQFCDSLLRNRMLNELFNESTPVILHEDDLNSMCYSIENRNPFLDKNLFEFCYSVPTEHLIHDGHGKFILREAMKGILNDTVRLDRRKKGFNASVDSFVDLQDSATIEYLTMKDARVFGIVDRDKMLSLLKDHSADNSYSKFIFNFINLRIFLN
jgi:asparagine synthase (glutamine-hydrolysing)